MSIAIGVKTSSKKTSIGRTERKTPKHDLASFCAQWTQKRGPEALQKLRGAANLQSKYLDFWRLNKIRMRSRGTRERNNLFTLQLTNKVTLTKLKVCPFHPQKFHLFINTANIFFCFTLH